jgi:hypothetical protein
LRKTNPINTSNEKIIIIIIHYILFSVILNVQTGSGAYTAFCSMIVGVLSPQTKRKGRELDQYPLSGVKDKKEPSYTFVPCMPS